MWLRLLDIWTDDLRTFGADRSQLRPCSLQTRSCASSSNCSLQPEAYNTPLLHWVESNNPIHTHAQKASSKILPKCQQPQAYRLKSPHCSSRLRRNWPKVILASWILCVLFVTAWSQFAVQSPRRDDAASRRSHRDRDHQRRLIVFLVKGFRWNYVDPDKHRSLRHLATDGAKADYLKPVFPTNGEPNSYSLVTGRRREGRCKDEYASVPVADARILSVDGQDPSHRLVPKNDIRSRQI